MVEFNLMVQELNFWTYRAKEWKIKQNELYNSRNTNMYKLLKYYTLKVNSTQQWQVNKHDSM